MNVQPEKKIAGQIPTAKEIAAEIGRGNEDQKLRDEGRVTEPRTLIVSGGLIGREIGKHWLPEGFPKTHAHAGTVLEETRGRYPVGLETGWREPLPGEEIGVSANMAHRFTVEAEGPVAKASGAVIEAKRIVRDRAAGVEAAKKALANAEKALAGAEEIVNVVGRNVEDAKAARAAWIEKSGRSEAELLAGVELLNRPAPAVADSGAFHVPAGSASSYVTPAVRVAGEKSGLYYDRDAVAGGRA